MEALISTRTYFPTLSYTPADMLSVRYCSLIFVPWDCALAPEHVLRLVSKPMGSRVIFDLS